MQLEEISYKDPSSFIQRIDNRLLRAITFKYKSEYEYLITSGLYETLTKKKLLIHHTELNGNEYYTKHNNIYKFIKPFQLDFISYPYEWCFQQWKAAIQCFLEINLTALEFGMILKDATPYNFAFIGSECVLIDTGSFAFYKDGNPWIGYRQFCEEFLAPIALMKFNNSMWGKLYRISLQGFPLSIVSNELPFKSMFNVTCLLHIHLHALVSTTKKKQNSATYFSEKKLSELFRTIKNSVNKWNNVKRVQNFWLEYYDINVDNNYSYKKENIVKSWLQTLNSTSIIDIGANTGKYSQLASAYCQKVYAIESDITCCDQIYGLRNDKINTIYADIAEPSPSLGWLNKEKKSLLTRLNADTVLMLAVIHHLAISRNIPLEFIAKLACQLTTNNLIIEFVSKKDEKVKAMLETREDIFDNYNEANFISVFSEHFTLIHSETLDASATRKIFLWEKK